MGIYVYISSDIRIGVFSEYNIARCYGLSFGERHQNRQGNIEWPRCLGMVREYHE